MARLIFFSFFLFIIIYQINGEVPDYIKICGRRNPDLNNCIKNSIEQLRPQLKKGIPELNVPSIDPFYLDSDLLLVNSNELKALATSIELFNMGSFEITQASVDFDNKIINTGIYVDKIHLKGTYDVTGKIIVPIKGKGPIEIDAEGLNSTATMKYELIDTKRGKRMYFTSLACKIHIKDYKAKFDIREGTGVTLGAAINEVINSNRQEIIEGIVPDLEKAISGKILELANNICKKFTFDELFPDRE